MGFFPTIHRASSIPTAADGCPSTVWGCISAAQTNLQRLLQLALRFTHAKPMKRSEGATQSAAMLGWDAHEAVLSALVEQCHVHSLFNMPFSDSDWFRNFPPAKHPCSFQQSSTWNDADGRLPGRNVFFCFIESQESVIFCQFD